MIKTILLADDDDSVRHALSRVLASEDYQVLLAKSGDEAAAQFRATPPDLVLLDLNMPGSDGWQAFSTMTRIDPMVPVVVITARPHQYAKAVELGVDALMEKPLDLPLLFSAIIHLLAETEASRVERLTNRTFTTEFLAHGAGEVCC